MTLFDVPETLEPGDLDDLREYIRIQVAAGYRAVPDVVEEAVEVFADTTLPPAALRDAATSAADEALAAHLADQATWPATTDCDRLDAAFSALEAAGVVARQNFSCCGNCGATEIHEEMDAAADQGATVRGYTFFHLQDTEHAVDGDSLFLSYGSADNDREAAIAIGHEIVAALRDQGLQPAWNGRHANRIGLPIVWRRRRTAG
ncbi:MAG TPA: hypothetical protein VH561_19965 [Micromonosporaceae bacterium]|jgi:hypothetical protein